MLKKLAGTVSLALVLVACGQAAPDTLKLVAHDSFAAGVTEETFAAFTEETGIEVEVIAAGDAGSLVNQAVLTKDNPLADVLFGVDDAFLSRALDGGIFASYRSPLIESVDPRLIVADGDWVTPIDFGDVCINYDKDWFHENQVPIPRHLDELTEGLYAANLTVEHPATSSPGLAFMLATIAEFGEEGWLDFWRGLRASGVRVAPDWDTAYFGDFTRYGGSSPMVVSYASSPPAEVIFAEEPLEAAPTGVITAGCYRQIEFAGILAGTEHEEAAGQLVDFMLGIEFQEAIPLTWFVFPANDDATLPAEFVEFTVLPPSPASVDPTVIAANRERWTDEWIEVMEG